MPSDNELADADKGEVEPEDGVAQGLATVASPELPMDGDNGPISEELDKIISETKDPEKLKSIMLKLSRGEMFSHHFSGPIPQDPSVVRIQAEYEFKQTEAKFNFARENFVWADKQEKRENGHRWYLSIVSTIVGFFVLIFSVYLIISGEKEIGLTILTHSLALVAGGAAGHGFAKSSRQSSD